jgi:hypothetical protein
MTVAGSASSARQRLESEGVRVDEVYTLDQHDRTFEVVLSPPSRPIAQVETLQSEEERLQRERLRKGYQINDVGSRIPSNQAISEEYRAAHNGEEPSFEYVMGEALKRAKESVAAGVTPPPRQEVVAGQSGTGTELTSQAEKPAQASGSDSAQGEQQERYTFKSERRRAIAYYIDTHKKASDQQILGYLRENHPKLVPASWEHDTKLAADTFTKVRRALRAKEQKRVNSPVARH